MTTRTVTYLLPELWMELKDRSLLAELMEERNISQRHLARVAGYKSHTYVQRLLRGEEKTLKAEPAARIAHELKIPFSLLFRTRTSSDAAQSVRPSRKDDAA